MMRAQRNNTPIIRMMIANLTFVNMVTTIDPIIIKLICVASKIDFGSASSAQPISLEKRFMIRPDGFVSKNRIFVDTKTRNILSCKFCDAVAQNWKNVTDRVRAITNKDTKMPP